MKNEFKKRFISRRSRGRSIAFFIIALPFLFYSYLLIPEGINSYEILSFKIDNFGYGDINTLFWFINSKLMLIAFLYIWFTVCKQWWRNAILIPLIIEFTKLITTFNTSIGYFDEVDHIKSLPITAPIILLLFFITKKFSNYYKSEKLLKCINKEISKTLTDINKGKEREIIIFKEMLTSLKLEKSKLEKHEYIKKLLELQDSISST